MHNLTEAQLKECLTDFYQIVGSLSGYDEAKSFLKDLLTTSEMVMVSRRLQIAKYLARGWTHDQIREYFGAGYSTIVQVDRWLNDGFGGYRQALKKHKEKADNKKTYVPPSPHSWEKLRKSYPRHFLFLNLLLDKDKD